MRWNHAPFASLPSKLRFVIKMALIFLEERVHGSYLLPLLAVLSVLSPEPSDPVPTPALYFWPVSRQAVSTLKAKGKISNSDLALLKILIVSLSLNFASSLIFKTSNQNLLYLDYYDFFGTPLNLNFMPELSVSLGSLVPALLLVLFSTYACLPCIDCRFPESNGQVFPLLNHQHLAQR